jgi:integral membrane sensor domain MASE1
MRTMRPVTDAEVLILVGAFVLTGLLCLGVAFWLGLPRATVAIALWIAGEATGIGVGLAAARASRRRYLRNAGA